MAIRAHDYPMVITAIIGNADVKRVFVDEGSSADILFYDAFRKMEFTNKDLKSYEFELVGFSSEHV